MMNIMMMTEQDLKLLLRDREELKRSKEEIVSKYRALDAKYREQSVDLSNLQDYAEGIEEELHNISIDRDRYKALYTNYKDLFCFEAEANKKLRQKYGEEDFRN